MPCYVCFSLPFIQHGWQATFCYCQRRNNGSSLMATSLDGCLSLPMCFKHCLALATPQGSRRAEPPKGSGGQPRTISGRVEQHLQATLLANRWQSPLEITIILKREGITISLSMVKRFMRKEGLRQYVARHKPFLTNAAKATQLAYARKHLMEGLDSWRRAICCDEAAIRLNYAARRFVT